MGTLHTRSALEVIDRLLSFYNNNEQKPMRVQILNSLVAVISQLLVITTDDKRRLPVNDILINTPTMKDYLLADDKEEAKRLMETDIEGMQVMNQAIYEHLFQENITMAEAWKMSPNREDLERRIRTGDIDPHSLAREWLADDEIDDEEL